MYILAGLASGRRRARGTPPVGGGTLGYRKSRIDRGAGRRVTPPHVVRSRDPCEQGSSLVKGVGLWMIISGICGSSGGSSRI